MKFAKSTSFKFTIGVIAVLTLSAAVLSAFSAILLFDYGGYRDFSEFYLRTVSSQLSEDTDLAAEWYSDRDVNEVSDLSWYETYFDPQTTAFRFSVLDADTGDTLLTNGSGADSWLQEPETRTLSAHFDPHAHSNSVWASDSGAVYCIDAVGNWCEMSSGFLDAAACTDSADALVGYLNDVELWGGAEGFYYQSTDGTTTHYDDPMQFVLAICRDRTPQTIPSVTVNISVSLAEDPGAYSDCYGSFYRIDTAIYQARNALPVICGICTAAALASVIFLMYAAGRREGSDEIVLRGFDRIPWDLLAVLSLLLECVMIGVAGASLETFRDVASRGSVLLCAASAVLCVCAVCGSTLFVGTCTSFGARWKTKGWARSSLIYRLCRLLWRGARKLARIFVRLLRSIPLVPKTAGIGFLLLLILLFCACDPYHRFPFLTAVLLILLYLAAVALAVLLRRLQAGAQALARGDLDYRVDTAHLFGALKQHADDLNDIRGSISAAVEQQMKSERMKTELITNVSHDLKTPLTSIVSYVDLLSKTELSEEARGYVEVLQRQSARLKRLTEDLVEASKASSGVLESDPRPLNLNELLEQAGAEYDERLSNAGISPVLNMPEKPLYAMADGRHLWRILDNLLSNVCKYALPGTRVYISASMEDGYAAVSVKNISREALNVSADELMERFVRGDASRSTEGSGLGLSIAESLARLMGGSLMLTVDGDLFKAEVRLTPVVPNP